jgi:hypothetical protein
MRPRCGVPTFPWPGVEATAPAGRARRALPVGIQCYSRRGTNGRWATPFPAVHERTARLRELDKRLIPMLRSRRYQCKRQGNST